MYSAIESLQVGLSGAKVVGSAAVNAFTSLPLPLVFILFLACLTALQWTPPPSLPPTLPLHTVLVQLPSPRPGHFVYLDKPSRQLVVSETPLLPLSPHKEPKPRPNRARQVFRSYRPPLGCVPEDIEMDPSLAV